MRILALGILLLQLTLAAVEPAWEQIPGPARELVDRILTINAVLEPELDVAAAHAEFARLVAVLRPQVERARPQAVIAAFNQVILADRKVAYLSRQYWRDSSFVAALLRGRGNCLATTTLYVAVARALDQPVHAVLVPEHAFACWSTPKLRINIETTAGGVAVPDRAYTTRFADNPEDYEFHGWMKPLGDDELLATLELVAAHHLEGQQRIPQARTRLAAAMRVLPWRSDLTLLDLSWNADLTRERAPLLAAAERLAGDREAARPAVLAALRMLAQEHRARLDRQAERTVLLRAYGLAPWHEQDELLEQMSTCLRGMRDHSGAALCMELAVTRDPENLGKRAWLAGMLVEARRIDEGLAMIAKVRTENPEEVYFANMQAGLLVTAGRREEGRRIFDGLTPPRTGIETYETNRAWFFAVWGDRAEFYPQFAKALELATSPSILSWIAEDDDLDAYRQEPRFIELVTACRKRLLGAVTSDANGR